LKGEIAAVSIQKGKEVVRIEAEAIRELEGRIDERFLGPWKFF